MAEEGGSAYRVEPLARQHDRSAFACGVESLDRYLKTQATQDIRRKANAVFVLVEPAAPERILGYFTLCAFTLAQGAVPKAARRHIPRYPLVSATLIGRLAVAKERHRQGLGGVLLAQAMRMAYENAAVVGSSMIVVDAIDENAQNFYEAHGFLRLADTMRMIIPMALVAELVST